MVIEDKAGSTIVSGGVSNVLSTSVLESLYEEEDDSSSTTDETTDQGGGLDSGGFGTLRSGMLEEFVLQIEVWYVVWYPFWKPLKRGKRKSTHVHCAASKNKKLHRKAFLPITA